MLFLTGFPGFIGERLIRRLRTILPDKAITCLVQDHYMELAESLSAGLDLNLVRGDITRDNLGLGNSIVPEQIKDVWHLAALYDLAADRETARQINVEGTRNVLNFCSSLPNMKRLNYVSTCYVSGNHAGTFMETDLDLSQDFKNHYEWSKFESEKLVKDFAREKPVTVFRPAIVVGDSRTGMTMKFDGPYFVMEAMRRLPSISLFLKIATGTAEINLVPVDYVVDAMCYLGTRDSSIGLTYHLADTDPMQVFAIEKLMAKSMGRHYFYLPVPCSVAKWVFSFRIIRHLLGIPAQAVDYFVHPVHYDTTQILRDLEGSGISCPPIESYMSTLIRYFLKNRKEVRSEAMK